MKLPKTNKVLYYFIGDIKMVLLHSYLRPHNPEIDEKFHQLTKFNVLSSASFSHFMQMIEGVEGDIVECGIGRSRSLIILCSLAQQMHSTRRIIGYDSFAGFPEPSMEDISYRNPKKGEWSKSPSNKYEYTESFCLSILEAAEIPLNQLNLSLGKGYFEDTLPSNDSKQIALLNLDGDLYGSYKACLENLFPKMASGGVIIFDDFEEERKHAAFPGSRLAVKEFLGLSEYKKIKLSKFGVYYYIK